MNDFTNSIDAISQSFVGKTELVLKDGCELNAFNSWIRHKILGWCFWC